MPSLLVRFTLICSLLFTPLSLPLNAEVIPSRQSVEHIRVGADRLDQLLPFLHGERVGVVSNQSGVLSDAQKTLLIDTLLRRGVQIKKLFSPEHGFRGDADAGAKVSSGKAPVTGLPIISLYGRHRKPTKSDLSGLSILILDLQDVGVRFYTYISTMGLVLEACAEEDLPVIILDRPNPHDAVDGPMISPAYKSFIGMFPIPVLHGLTMGELALMAVGEGWLKTKKSPSVTVVRCEGWKHGMRYLPPIPPSPNLRSARALALYPTLCFFEGSSWSVGRGTTHPFEQIGYPLQGLGERSFVPRSLPGASKPLHVGRRCYGPDPAMRESWEGIDLELIIECYRRSQKAGVRFFARPDHFDLLAGSSSLRRQIERGSSPRAIRASWEKGLEDYRRLRSKYLLYP